MVEGTRSKRQAGLWGRANFCPFPGREHTSAQWHSSLCGPRRPSTAGLATGSEAQQGVGVLPKIQHPHFSPMNWPRPCLHCYLRIVLMEFLSSSLPFFYIPSQHQKNNRQGSNSILWSKNTYLMGRLYCQKINAHIPIIMFLVCVSIISQ